MKEKCHVSVVRVATWPPGELEVEYKYELDRSAYELLLSKVAGFKQERYRFLTYYFDTKKWVLRRNDFNLRLRVSDRGRAILGLKFPANLELDTEATPKLRWEVEDPIPATLQAKLIADEIGVAELDFRPIAILKANFEAERLEKVRSFGKIPSERVDVLVEAGIKLQIDRFSILGVEYYEVEVEVHSGDAQVTHEKVTGLFAKWGVPWKLASRSKRSRLVDAVRKN